MYIEISMILYDISCGDLQYNETRRYMCIYIYVYIQTHSLSLCVCFNTYISNNSCILFKAMPIEGRIVSLSIEGRILSLSSTISECTRGPPAYARLILEAGSAATSTTMLQWPEPMWWTTWKAQPQTNHLVPPPGRGIGPLGFGIFGMPMGMSLAHTKQRWQRLHPHLKHLFANN